MLFIFDKTTTAAASGAVRKPLLWLLRTDYFLVSKELCFVMEYNTVLRPSENAFLRLARWAREISDLKSAAVQSYVSLR